MAPVTTTKTMVTGMKRKSAPAKEVHVKENKKAKIDSGKMGKESKTKAKPVKKVESESENEEDFDSEDGGADLESASADGSDNDTDMKEIEGLHPDRVKAVAANNQSAREAHAKQKQLANDRKAAKPLADQLARTKKIWERLRRKSHVPKEERKQLVEELFELITGNIKDFVLKHDSVRVVQTAVKYSNPEQKRLIAKELAGTYRQLAESRYAKFLIGKLLIQGDDEIRDLIVPEFYGHVRRLIKHPEAGWILDDIYRGVATKQQKAIILREWYGAEFAVMERDTSTFLTGELSEILAAEPGKRASIMRYLQEMINHLLQKKTNGFTLLHDAMLQYFLNAKQGTEEITDFIELLKGDEEADLMKNLAFTKSGARVVCLALVYGGAKDRKHILKMYKDTLQLMAGDPNGHIVILTAYEVIDDTVLTAKSIFPELLSKDEEKQVENIMFSANDLNARTTLLYLFQGRSKSLFPSSHNSDLELLSEIDTIRTTTSKKDPEIRRQELIKALSPYLLKAIASASRELIATSFGCQFITEVLFGAEGDKTAALESLAEAVSGDPTYIQPPVEEGAVSEQPPSHIASAPFGGKMIKTLIAGGRFDAATKSIVSVVPALNFGDILYPHIKEYITEWATGSSSFVVLALLESESFGNKDEVKDILTEDKKKLEKAAKEETVEQKAKREEFEAKEKDKKASGKGAAKKGKGAKEKEVGNKGSSMILAMI
ncbi:putative Pumilio like proteiny domain family member 6 [Sclerotinia borealis F-4128]|uniref:Putative Pumilio like proteiny domain family member 6 n=1 Tax=Sclerotinia borealis (strain F-4128) TaxID=1432307 RepID=W9CLX5_SCLBF|nr:putative Pumilio like proteiny domain family member 6 [Sclerotinia borealis F-4128]